MMAALTQEEINELQRVLPLVKEVHALVQQKVSQKPASSAPHSDLLSRMTLALLQATEGKQPLTEEQIAAWRQEAEALP